MWGNVAINMWAVERVLTLEHDFKEQDEQRCPRV